MRIEVKMSYLSILMLLKPSRVGKIQIKLNTKASPLQILFWWSALVFLTFQTRYYNLYLPKEELLYRDFKYILGCSGFRVDNLDCPEYLYGRFLRFFLDQLTILHPYTELVVIVFICISWIPLAYLFVQIDKASLKIVLLLLFLSPSIALLIQRGNLDILIFSLCWIAIKLFLQGNVTPSLLIVILASSFKIYPVALLLLLVAFALIKEASAKAKVIWVLLTGLALWSALIDVSNIPWLPSDARNSFGLRIFGEYLTYMISGSGFQMLPIFGILLGILILGFTTILMASSKFENCFPRYEVSLESTIWFLYFLAIFASGISIDYRLIFLLPSLILMAEFDKLMRYMVTFLLVLSFYLSYPFEILQVFGDIALFMLLSFIIVLLYKNRESFFRQTSLWRSGAS